MKYKLAILTSHPIQYQTPFFKLLAKHSKIELMVYFCWNFGVNEKAYDPEFGKMIKWDIPLLEGYRYKFLNNYSPWPASNFFGQINPGIIRELWRNRYDSILIFGWNSFTNWLAFFVAFVLRIPILLRSENPLNQEFLKPKWKIMIKRIILGSLFKHVKGFLFIGEENKEFYRYYGVSESKLFFAPYAVDNERFIRSYDMLREKKNELKQGLGIALDKVVIFFCGKLIDKKRPLDLLLAYERVKTPNKALIFIGDGELREKIEESIREKELKDVYILGFKNQTELPQYYVLGDIFVLPSGMGETWGLVVNEAMCFKLPIIISDMVGCAKDLVKHGRNGYIYPMGDVEKLVSYLEILINDEDKRRKFGEESFKMVQGYSYQKDMEELVKALEYIRDDKFF